MQTLKTIVKPYQKDCYDLLIQQHVSQIPSVSTINDIIIIVLINKSDDLNMSSKPKSNHNNARKTTNG